MMGHAKSIGRLARGGWRSCSELAIENGMMLQAWKFCRAVLR
jgi:hypothetical protein